MQPNIILFSKPQWQTAKGETLPETAPADNDTKERPFQYRRMLERLPANVRESLTQQQLDFISDALIPEASTHVIDYRVSVPFFGRRFYLTLFAGRERRSLERLAQEAQTQARRITIFYAVIILGAWCLGVMASIVFAYLIKSWFIADLMDGPSMFHGFFFQPTAILPIG